MIQKPITRSVIAAVVVAGMLTLCLVSTKPLTNTAFAKTSCEVGITAYAHGGGWPSGGLAIAKGETTPIDLNVGLSCPPGTPVSGATINVSGDGGSKSVTTDFRGLAIATFDLGPNS